MGKAKTAQLKTALELGLRLETLQPEGHLTIGILQDVLNLIGTEMELLEQEELRVFLLTAKQ